MGYVNPAINEGLADVEALALIMADASGTMAEIELRTGEQKSLCVAWMIQEFLNALDDPQYQDTFVTLAFFSADRDGVKIVSVLEEHNAYTLKTYSDNTDLTIWDGLSPQNRAQGMGGRTPIGTALAWARKRAEEWVNAATGQVPRRCVIYLLSDGMNTYGPDGMEERAAIEAFNASCENGNIRLATIGYFQTQEGEGTRPDEEAGRRFLRALPLNKDAYFEADNTQAIVRYILSTMTQVMKV